MSKEQLMVVNNRLIQHFKETGIFDAYYYEPVNDVYWNKTATSWNAVLIELAGRTSV